MSLVSEQRSTFPVDVISVQGGWAIAVQSKKGQGHMLLQPGWNNAETTNTGAQPYIFETAEAAWDFVRKIHRFWQHTQAMRQFGAQHHTHCESCGRNVKALYNSPYCQQCLETNDDALHQFCVGVYHRTGDSQETIGRLAATLQVAKKKDLQKKRAEQRLSQAVGYTLNMGNARRYSKPNDYATQRVAGDYQAYRNN